MELIHLFNDVPSYENDEFLIYPVYIFGKDNDFIRVLTGKPVTDGYADEDLAKEGAYGIFVTFDDYCKIDHKKRYLLIHDVEINSEEIIKLDKKIDEDTKDPGKGMHVHIVKGKQSCNSSNTIH